MIKKLRTNNGREYYVPKYFKSIGVIHESNTSYSPQQNDIAKRKNLVFKEMINIMLFIYGLSDGFWDETMIRACYVLNRVPTKMNKTTPYEFATKENLI